MVPDQYILDSIFRAPSDEERQFFAGTRSDYIAAFVRDSFDSQNTTHQNYARFLKISLDFMEAAQVSVTDNSDHLSFVGETAVEGTSHLIRGMGLANENIRGKIFLSLNHFTAAAADTGFFTAFRPMPVKWHMEHINKRAIERGGKILDSEDIKFTHYNVLALAMLRIIEKEKDTNGTGYFPIMIPTDKGIFLGHTMRFGEKTAYNRISLMASHDIQSMPMAPYMWCPTMAITMRTFLSGHEMSVSEHKLKNLLKPFMKDPHLTNLSLGLECMDDLIQNPRFESSPYKDGYSQSMEQLKKIMTSPLWDFAVRLPIHLRQAPIPLVR